MPQGTKEVFLASLDCRGMGWLLLNSGDISEPTEGAKFRMDPGKEIGERARQAIPGGTFVVPNGSMSAAERTASLIDKASIENLYEATFEVDGLVAKADILRREPSGWNVIEVKSGSRDKPERVKDLAYTVMVARRAGLPVSHAALMLISKDYRLGMSPTDLFVEVDHTEDVDGLVPSFTTHWEAVSGVVLGENRPLPEFTFACRDCEHYANNCIGKGIKDPLFDLARLSRSKFDALKKLDINCIADIPADFKLTDNQERVRQTVVSGQPWESSNLRSALEQVKWSALYLDFETTTTAVPLFPGVAPFEQLPTQYSIHVYADVETETDHKEFLADHTVDDRRSLAERLLADLAGTGSIVVYSLFEKRILNYLGKLFPDLADQFADCVTRLFDLEAVIKGNFYHPAFRGKSSIKCTLPALVKGMDYDSLAIGNGDDASALFARMARGEKSEIECAAIRENLLAYCKQDTLAMVRLHRALWKLVN